MIRIVDSLWRVVDVSPCNTILMRNNGSFTIGCCDSYNRTIYISNNLSYAKYKQVMAHELTHAFMYELGIHIPLAEEERICNLVADYGRSLFDIVDMLLEEIEKARA